MTRPIRTLSQAKQVMEPINDELVSCIEKGFRQYMKLISGLDQISEFVEFQPRTKASIIHDFIRSNTQQAFSDKENIRVGEFNKVFGITIEDQFFIRFKKMDRNLTVSSYRTTQHQKYLSQEHIEGFPKEPTFLFAGYIPNRTWTSIEGIYLACWKSDILEWYDEKGKYSYEQISLDFEQDEESVYTAIEKRVKLKKNIREDDQTGTEN